KHYSRHNGTGQQRRNPLRESLILPIVGRILGLILGLAGRPHSLLCYGLSYNDPRYDGTSPD
ncbi:MAG: hypothetical protein ACUVQG_08740, partial [Thermogutta sp.]